MARVQLNSNGQKRKRRLVSQTLEITSKMQAIEQRDLTDPRQDAPPQQAQDAKYVTGEQALVLDKDGCGFCYYKSGRVAICISKVNSYQRRYFAYKDNPRKTLLLSLDEHAVGSAGNPKSGNKIVLTRQCGLISDDENNIIQQWKWDPNAQNAGEPPKTAVQIELSESLMFTFVSRQQIHLRFSHEGVVMDFECGEKLRRTDTYLDGSTRIKYGPNRGKLLINAPAKTLIQRQKDIELECIAKRSKQKPKSNDMRTEAIRDIVSQLENDFEDYSISHNQHEHEEHWKTKARKQTMAEVPLVAPTTHEVGAEPVRFGQTLDPSQISQFNKEVAKSTLRLKGQEGNWLDSIQIHRQLHKENPILKRSSGLCNASGRYSIDVQVPGGQAVAKGKTLRQVTAKEFDNYLRQGCGMDQIVVVACLRNDDRTCRRVEKVLELVNERIAQAEIGRPKGTKKVDLSMYTPERDNIYQIIKFEMAESSFMRRRYSVHALPTYLFFYGGKLVTITTLGGEAVRIGPTTRNASLVHVMDHPPFTLLIEPEFKKQIIAEKILKKEAFKWDLAMNGTEAAAHTTRVVDAASGQGSKSHDLYGLVILSDKVSLEDAKSIERSVARCKPRATPSSDDGTSSAKSSEGAIIACAIITKHTLRFSSHMCNRCRIGYGRRVSVETEAPKQNEVCPHCGIICDPVNCLPSSLSSFVQVCVYKHFKAATLIRLAEMWHETKARGKYDKTESHKGLTEDALVKQMDRSLLEARRGRFLPQNFTRGILLSSSETHVHGVPLGASVSR